MKHRVIVNGQSIKLKQRDNETVADVMRRALKKSGNLIDPLDEWEMRNSEGVVMNPEEAVKIADKRELAYLNRKAGVGGAIAA